MADQRMLARRFDGQRPRLVAVARRLLGSTVEAEDVVQDAWLRLQRVDPDQLDNVDAWLTTVVSRLSLDVLRSARHTKERAWAVTKWSDAASSRGDPELEATQNDRISVALLTVLELLSPAERLAFVLHDVFGLSFDEVAHMLNRSADASRQLASRARRRLRNGDATIGPDGRRARPIVAAWLAAVQDGDFDALLGLLDDGAVLRADYGTHGQQLRGARQIAENAVVAQTLAAHSIPVLIDGDPGVAVVVRDSVLTLMAFEIRHGRIVGLDVLADSARIAELRLTTHSVQVDPA
jgi:RNA polymerase sigma-70 factor (ECF subfamily)